MATTILEGGCHCGAVRYRATGEPRRAPYCHCSMCRRTTGAPVVAWAIFAAKDFAFTRGEPVRYASSAGATRSFCGRCGAQLTFQHNDGDEIDVTLATLDDAARIQPTHHVYEADRLPWLAMHDGLPRYPALPRHQS